MFSRRLCLAIIAAALLSGCASVDPQQATSAEARPEKVYNTGSRIPVRDRSEGSADVKSVDSQGATDILNKRDSTVPTKGGGGM